MLCGFFMSYHFKNFYKYEVELTGFYKTKYLLAQFVMGNSIFEVLSYLNLLKNSLTQSSSLTSHLNCFNSPNACLSPSFSATTIP